MSIHSSAICPRLAKSAPSASNSSLIHPIPTPSTSRPDDRVSMPASILAAATGLRSGRTRTLIPMPIRLVRPATKASRVTGSSRGWSGSKGAGSASPYG